MNHPRICPDNLAKSIVASFEELAKSLSNGDRITEVFNCRKVTLDLRPMPYDPALVKKTRALLKASQSVFAHFIGVKVATVQKWESGKQSPSDMACRFMDEIRLDPTYWQSRIAASIKVRAS